MGWAPKSFAPFLAFAFILWPIIAYMGAQGFTGAVALIALVSVFYLTLGRIPLYAIFFILFVLWIVAASAWSPGDKPFISGSFAEGTFTMDLVGARFGLTALAGLGVLLAISSAPEGGAHRSLRLMRWVGLIQGLGVIVTAIFMDQILALLAPLSDPVKEMPQNLLRNANAYLLLLPLLLAWVWHRWGALPVALWGGVSLAAFVVTGTQTALIGSGFMLAAMGLIKLMPKNGFRALFGGLAVYLAFAPVIIGYGLSALRHIGLPLPHSFLSRSYSWELVTQKVAERPLVGHGLEASQTWRETYSEYPDWLAHVVSQGGAEYAWKVYPVIPSHPHNMPLQIWAETGAVGALLGAGFLLCLGLRLKAPGEWPPIARYAAAGLVGVACAICSFSYSMWNEAFWASLALASALIWVQAKQET